jgi:DnaJ-class molecular chaperone
MKFATAPPDSDYWSRYTQTFRDILEESYRQTGRARPIAIPSDEKELRKAAKTLGVTLPTTAEAIQAAWKRQAKKHHPDRHPEREDRSTEKMVAVNVARDLLLKDLNAPSRR